MTDKVPLENVFGISDADAAAAFKLSQQFNLAAEGLNVGQAVSAAAFFINQCLLKLPHHVRPIMYRVAIECIAIGMPEVKSPSSSKSDSDHG